MVVEKLQEKLEALLFASGRAMEVSKLTDIVGEKYKRNVIKTLGKIKEDYDKRNSPVMLVEQEDSWKLTVREEYLPLVRRIVSDMELPKSVLETLAVIAWKSPLMQSQLIKVRTNKAYEHIELLERMNFINKTKAGRSYRLSLAEKFFEYFDVKDGQIKRVFNDVKGVEKELEIEHQKHLDQLENNEKKTINEADKKDDNIDEIKLGMDREKEHLGELEVVDAISEDIGADIEIVDEISEDEKPDEVDIEDLKKSKIEELARAAEKNQPNDVEVEEVDEIIEELDEEEKAKEEIEDILEEAIEKEEKQE